MSKAGRAFRAANNSRIPNLGELDAVFRSGEGHSCALPIQVAEIERPLIAVSQLAAAGNKVVLEKTHGEIINNTTGRKIHLPREGGVYIFEMWLEVEEDDPAPGFTRRGR